MPCAPGFTAPIPWRLTIDPPLPGEENMARDRAALEAQKDPHALPAVRLFQWAAPTVSYGRLQDKAAAVLFARGLAREVVQRPTGGGMVCHRGDLSFSIVWRRDHAGFPGCIKNVYRAIHEAVAVALRVQGLDVGFYEREERRPPGRCFTEPVESDLIWREIKVLGGALQVTRWGRLYQGDLRARELGLNPAAAAGLLAQAFGGMFRRPPG